jgi:hypothetical protein
LTVDEYEQIANPDLKADAREPRQLPFNGMDDHSRPTFLWVNTTKTVLVDGRKGSGGASIGRVRSVELALPLQALGTLVSGHPGPA